MRDPGETDVVLECDPGTNPPIVDFIDPDYPRPEMFGINPDDGRPEL